MRRTQTVSLADIEGIVALIALAVAYNALAPRRNRNTISTQIRALGRHHYGAWIVGGACGALLTHWFIEGN